MSALVDDIVAFVESVTPEALAVLGLTELGPALLGAEKLVKLISDAIEAHSANLPVEVAAADVAADVASAEKFNKP
jgi:hypothetical protein